MIETYIDPYSTCDECHQRRGVFVAFVILDDHGGIDPEAGCVICADCLRRALQAIGDYQADENDERDEAAP